MLNLEPKGYSQEARVILEQFARVENGPLTRQELMENVGRFDALIVRLGHVIDREVLDRGKRLKAVATATTGLNHIDVEAAKRRNVDVLSLRGETEFLEEIHATSEHTWALLLALIRKVPAAVSHVRDGGWDRDCFKGSELYGKTLGIIGFGRIGSKLAKYAAAFGMEVLAHDIKVFQSSEYVKVVPLDMLLAQSDIVSVNVAYNDSTHHVIDARAIAAMKKGAVLINTSRGEVIDQDALLAALQSGHVAGAALDVLEGEYSHDKDWAKKDPLVEYVRGNQNLLVTPHIGGATFESMEKTEVFIAQKLRSFFTEKKFGKQSI